MNKQSLLKKVGNMQQLAHVRPITYAEGRAKNTTGYDIKNGDIRFQVLGDKCLDIADFSYKGINLSFMAKPGLIGRMDYDTHGEEGVKSLMGGLLFTCGLENTCLPCDENGKHYPMHGRIRSSPAENLAAQSVWDEDKYTLTVSGEMREAEIFGKNLVLSRKIETVFGEKKVLIKDTIENQGFTPEGMMILYHFNFGYPLLDAGSEILLPAIKTVARDKEAEKNFSMWNVMEEAVDGEPERVYLHELGAGHDGNTSTCIVNHDLEIGVQMDFNQKYLPHFVQWKSIASGDYVIGLEPMNSGVYGRVGEGENLHMLPPFEKEENLITLTILDGKEEIEAARNHIKRLVSYR